MTAVAFMSVMDTLRSGGTASTIHDLAGVSETWVDEFAFQRQHSAEHGGDESVLGMEFNLRGAVPEDAASMADLIVAAFSAQDRAVDPPQSALRETAETVARAIAAGGGVVATEAETLVGAVIWSERSGALYLSRVSVATSWRRRGVARAMLAECATIAHRRGLDRMTLGTRLALTGNRALFAAAGFHEISVHCHDGYTEPTWVEMERRLVP